MTDSEILEKVIQALKNSDIKLRKLSKKTMADMLNYNSHVTLYNVANGRNKMTEDMVNRIILHFPQVNYMFLTKGQEPVLKTGAALQAQKNVLNINTPEKKEPADLNSLLSLPNMMIDVQAQQIVIMKELQEIKELLLSKNKK